MHCLVGNPILQARRRGRRAYDQRDDKSVTEEQSLYEAYEALIDGSWPVVGDHRAVEITKSAFLKGASRTRRGERKRAGHCWRTGANRAKDALRRANPKRPHSHADARIVERLESGADRRQGRDAGNSARSLGAAFPRES